MLVNKIKSIIDLRSKQGKDNIYKGKIENIRKRKLY